MLVLATYHRLLRALLTVSAALLLMIVVSNTSKAADTPGQQSDTAKIVFPPLPKPGYDSSTHNWVDANLVTWSKITDAVRTYDEAASYCRTKNNSSPIQWVKWQLPTAELAENFYKDEVYTGKVAERRWPLNSIWLLSDGPNKKSVNLVKGAGTLNINVSPGTKNFAICVALPQGFDQSGNYFDGHFVWSKPTMIKDDYGNAIQDRPQVYENEKLNGNEVAYKRSHKLCNDMNKNDSSANGGWKLPFPFEYYYALHEMTIRTQGLIDAMSQKGWPAAQIVNLSVENYLLATYYFGNPSAAKDYYAICVRKQVISK
jgi:hypothetical protein